MPKCVSCQQRIRLRDGKCGCNIVSPGQSQNRDRFDKDKWCHIATCASRVINGKCMNAKCQTNQ